MEEELFYACQAAMEEMNDRCYINSAWSNHMTRDDNIFYNLDTWIKPQVKFRNGALVEAEGTGTIAIQTNKGIKYTNDVLLVPSLKHNLLNVGQMIENGYSLHFTGYICTILNKDTKQIIVKVKLQNRNFPIQFQTIDTAMKTELEDSWL